MNNWNLLLEKAQNFNIDLSESQIELFKKYWEFLYEYNQHTNIISSSSASEENVILKHFADSISIGLLKDHIDFNTPKRIIDMGTGGGFPGVPLMIAFSQWSLCAVDSVSKKTNFLKKLTEHLGLQNSIEIQNTRIEELARNSDKRDSFDLAVPRALSRLNILAEYCLPFLKKDGYLIAYKSKNYKEEIEESKKALHILGGEVKHIVPYTLSGEEERYLILIQKTRSTPLKYPRQTGVPTKNPL